MIFDFLIFGCWDLFDDLLLNPEIRKAKIENP